jgi:hypothetical protein
MNDPSGSFAQVAESGRNWLMLITAVPSKPDYLRVKLRRRVQRLGAVGLKGAVYLLPENADALESFQWLRREILADGGEATVCLAQLVDGMSDADVMALFNQDRDAEYQAFVAACREFEAGWPAGAVGDDAARPALIAERARLHRRLEEILGRDYFTAAHREDAMQAIERIAVLDIATPKASTSRNSSMAYHGRTWATRAGVKVDRIASAWLILRKIDPAAKFVFVAQGDPVPKGSVQFDMFDGEFTHDGNRCTFEVLLDRFAITEPAFTALGQMVHDIDLHDDTFGRPETAGLASMINGIASRISGDDERLLEGARLLDVLADGIDAGQQPQVN